VFLGILPNSCVGGGSIKYLCTKQTDVFAVVFILFRFANFSDDGWRSIQFQYP
jgi:hypothetical protein